MGVRDSALGFDQSKRFAWVLKPDDTVARRFVKIGRLHGQMRIVESGLKSDERIVVSGFQMLREGTPVKPVEIPMDPDELASGPAKGEKRKLGIIAAKVTAPTRVDESVSSNTSQPRATIKAQWADPALTLANQSLR